MPKLPPTPEVCPVCFEDVPPGAHACPECGADHNSGWREDDAHLDGLGLPGEDFDYEEFTEREFGSGGGLPRHIHPIWWITAVILLIAFIRWMLI